MRHIMYDTEGKRRDLVDGVKVYLDDRPAGGVSLLLIPDKERPLFHINVEAPDATVATGWRRNTNARSSPGATNHNRTAGAMKISDILTEDLVVTHLEGNSNGT